MDSRPPLRDPVSGAAVPEPMVPFVEALGLDGAVALCLKVGFSRVNVPVNPRSGDELVRLAGADTAARLADAMAGERVSVPFCRGFLIRYWRARGWTVGTLARRLKCSERNVYRVLAEAAAWPRSE